MRLTNVLLDKFMKGIPGNIWIGKHRFVPPVTKKDRLEMWKRMMYEEEVMMYLSNPYIKEEDEKLYIEKHTPPTQEKVFVVESSVLKPLKERTIAYHLERADSARSWGKHDS
ncbi:hypothetical protein X975_18749, partial [Stegodyphus mimosarum]